MNVKFYYFNKSFINLIKTIFLTLIFIKNMFAQCDWTLAAYENAGNMQNLLYLGIESSGTEYANNGMNLDYNEVLIIAGCNFYYFIPTEDLFVNTINLHMPVEYLLTNDEMLSDWVEQDGGVEFCRAARYSDIRPGDTTWGLIPIGSQQRGCGCNSGGWSGYGTYYGGFESG